ncbi:hypothetical protein MJO28_005808 [Puccinia striiformis f. sp. tritici]|uniref:Uncharacterized protein n=1 Tax=Puccinia striiformis f. sp. tritici TaxID=168172 RepID=A0ACC0ENM5_9BASI|nr:hypothetical protein MJO28_005808 [Puccinia striiformis f. sp. tritici]
MSISPLRACLVIIFILLAFIDGGTCSFPNVEDTLDLASDDFRLLHFARRTGTDKLAGDEDALSVSEIDVAMSKDKQRGKIEFPNISSDCIKESSQEKMWSKTNKIYTDYSLGLNKDAQKKFQSSFQQVWHILGEFSLDQDAKRKIYSIEEETQELFRIMGHFKEISTLLLGRENLKQSTFKSDPYSGILNLSDMLVHHLAFSARYKSMHDDTLKQFLNHEDHLMITYNYFWGNFLQNNDLTSLCLNQGLGHDLQKVPFTKYMQDYFKLLNEDTLIHLSRINLAMQMFKVVRMGLTTDTVFSRDFFSIVREFVLVTSTNSKELPFGIVANYNGLASKILNLLFQLQEGKVITCFETNMRYSKILLDTLEFLKKNMPNGSHWKFDDLPFDTQVKFSAIEEAFGYFSTALKLVYSKYVQTIQFEALGSVETKYKPSILYLTQIYTKDEVSNYTLKPYQRHNKRSALIIEQADSMLNKLRKVEDSDQRSFEQLVADKQTLKGILNKPIESSISDKYLK